MIKNFWTTTNGLRWGPFDPDDSVNFSFDAADFIAAAGTALTLQSCTVIVDPKLKLVADSAPVGTIKTVRIERDPLVDATAGDRMKITVRPVASDGQHQDTDYFLVLTA